jgi:hypothetical protein
MAADINLGWVYLGEFLTKTKIVNFFVFVGKFWEFLAY